LNYHQNWVLPSKSGTPSNWLGHQKTVLPSKMGITMIPMGLESKSGSVIKIGRTIQIGHTIKNKGQPIITKGQKWQESGQ
jgi:hypothetical protein